MTTLLTASPEPTSAAKTAPPLGVCVRFGVGILTQKLHSFIVWPRNRFGCASVSNPGSFQIGK